MITMLRKNAFSLVEILIVLVVLGILIALALPNYRISKERALDKEAKAALSFIRAAEKVHKMEHGFYYPHNSTTSDVAEINANLKLDFPISSVNWAITVCGMAGCESCRARRNDGTRTWSLNFASSEQPTCSGASCP